MIFAGIALLFSAGSNENKNDLMDLKKEKEHMDNLETYEISPSNIANKIKNKENIILLDVRTPAEYEESHLQNAILLPVQNLNEKTLAEVGLGEEAKNKEIIIYCRSGARSKTAYDIMSSLGYTNIKSMSGGMIHWLEDGHPFVEAGAYEEQKNMGNEDVAPNDPKISFDRTFHDFGLVPQYGGVVEAKFKVRNDGVKTLEIGKITTSCSCTSASISSSAIASGESAEMIVRFDPDFHDEPKDIFKRTIFIPTNDPSTPEAEITIQVDIEEGR
ncbi:MAG: Rhodanese-like protein [Parcubacteria group bacterium GW2011_GWC2_40_31]|nr:MAG: Rhodanese-like protein [Parcubacteria group bacterium GW2011_GWF2_40_10]KKR47993.1 MAG: Rhodanese-like protein [Parcubacteria group bacterium GW2011_GWA2_40_143]KKR60473.1 MAG: Rhodanese-like protein [Parcubacteria group bacterium GW2011_GWC2_40_31]KKR77150.1 MAG: Rhodanese-like protein [Parcubacteria group bacterium GW2011_GWE2_40_8]KKR81008.1 MAG: Rhodanese-like protein [Parcubacteria group bacterium GW2011_GWD2_40_9]